MANVSKFKMKNLTFANLAHKNANRTIRITQRKPLSAKLIVYNNMKIEKKTWPKYFQKILDGDKSFELRLADFDCKENDILVLREWDPKTKEYTGRKMEKKVTYIIRTKGAEDWGMWSKEDIDKFGFQITSFK